MRILTGLAMLMVLCAGTLQAQRWDDRHDDRGGWGDTPIEFGIRGGYDFSEDTGIAGAQIRVPIIEQLFIMPSADVFFDESPTEWQANADLAIRPDDFGGIYAGAGAAFMKRDETVDDDDDVQVGYNLFAGIDGGSILDTNLIPFVEARWTDMDDYDPFRLMAGFNVPLD
ncbi:MAG TPA: hypothetical protein VFI91_13145 [Longimicrobiaceae bacterium]|nr:hypothetical protein [Longimicrobiaceae bacterium]